MKRKSTFYQDLISLFYPRVCLTCGNSLYAGEEIMCTFCTYKLPKTNFHLLRDNPVSKMFWGRVEIESATAYLFFRKGSMVQSLLHHLKYRNRKEIGFFLGKKFAHELQKSILYENLDVLIPVPLHKKKLKKRGFNQSEQIARGMQKIVNVEISTGNLYRKKFTETQTRKNRYERWLNVGEMFGLNNPQLLENKHVLLIDDVITTGSTLEACAHTLNKIKGIKISIACIAYTND